jgi:zinc and cadmium transporter
MVGAIAGYLLADFSRGFSDLILPLTAGGFIYISSSDLIPELHRQSNRGYSLFAFFAFLMGIIFMGLAKKFLPA